MDNLPISRCIQLADFGEIKSVTLYHFSDASENGYGQCSYIRLVEYDNRVHCSLLLGKSRVVPKKFISIPRLELTAALLCVKMACLLKKKLDINCVDEVFWTDRNVVLGYITNTVKRFKTFVEDLKPLWPVESSKLRRKLMFSSGVTFQLKKILLMMHRDA